MNKDERAYVVVHAMVHHGRWFGDLVQLLLIMMVFVFANCFAPNHLPLQVSLSFQLMILRTPPGAQKRAIMGTVWCGIFFRSFIKKGTCAAHLE